MPDTTQQPTISPVAERVLTHAPQRLRLEPPPAPVPDRHWNFLMACLAVYVLTAVGRVHQLFGVLELLHLTLLSAAAATGYLLLSDRGIRRTRPILRSFTTRAVLAIGLWITLSIPGALWPGGAMHLLTDQYAKAAVMFVVIASAVRGLRDVERLTFAYLAGVAFYAAMLLARFRVGGGGGESWRLGSLYYYDANEFATLATMALPLGVYFLLRSGPLWRRAAAAGSLGVLTVAFIWAGSRGGFLALLAVGAFLLVRYTAVPVALRLGIATMLVVVFAAAASDTFWTEMRTILKPQDDYNFTGDQGRVEVWKRGIGYMLDNPVLGVGGDNFPTAEGTLSPLAREASIGHGVKWSAAHNSFLEIGAELGFPGLFLFLAALGSGFAALRAVRRAPSQRSSGARSPPPRQLAQALAAALLAYVVGGFFLSLAYHDMIYVLLALIVALHKVTVPGLRRRTRRAWSSSSF